MSVFTLLPNEVLGAVLDALCLQSMSGTDRLPCLLVCKQWTAILELSLFRNVSLRYGDNATANSSNRGGFGSGSGSGSRIAQLLGFLRLKPHLCTQVSSMFIEIRKMDDWIYSRTREILSLCRAVRTLDLRIYTYGAELPMLYRTAVREKQTSMLRLAGDMGLQRFVVSNSCALEVVIQSIGHSKIGQLVLYGPYWSTDLPLPTSSSSSLMPSVTETEKLENDARSLLNKLDQSRGEDFFHTGEVKDIHLEQCALSAYDLALFFRWPRRIEQLQLRNVQMPIRVSQQQLDNMLWPHRESITALSIDRLRFNRDCERRRRGDDDGNGDGDDAVEPPRIDLGHLSNLRRLTISVCNIHLSSSLLLSLSPTRRRTHELTTWTRNIPCMVTKAAMTTLETIVVEMTTTTLPEDHRTNHFKTYDEATTFLTAWFSELLASLRERERERERDGRPLIALKNIVLTGLWTELVNDDDDDNDDQQSAKQVWSRWLPPFRARLRSVGVELRCPDS